MATRATERPATGHLEGHLEQGPPTPPRSWGLAAAVSTVGLVLCLLCLWFHQVAWCGPMWAGPLPQWSDTFVQMVSFVASAAVTTLLFRYAASPLIPWLSWVGFVAAGLTWLGGGPASTHDFIMVLYGVAVLASIPSVMLLAIDDEGRLANSWTRMFASVYIPALVVLAALVAISADPLFRNPFTLIASRSFVNLVAGAHVWAAFVAVGAAAVLLVLAVELRHERARSVQVVRAVVLVLAVVDAAWSLFSLLGPTGWWDEPRWANAEGIATSLLDPVLSAVIIVTAFRSRRRQA